MSTSIGTFKRTVGSIHVPFSEPPHIIVAPALVAVSIHEITRDVAPEFTSADT